MAGAYRSAWECVDEVLLPCKAKPWPFILPLSLRISFCFVFSLCAKQQNNVAYADWIKVLWSETEAFNSIDCVFYIGRFSLSDLILMTLNWSVGAGFKMHTRVFLSACLWTPLCPRGCTVGRPHFEELVSLCLDTRHTHAVDIDFTSETV